MSDKCRICGKALKDDLFSSVAKEPVCCVCKIKYIGWLPSTQTRIDAARESLGLKDGEYLAQDYGAECGKILGRTYTFKVGKEKP